MFQKLYQNARKEEEVQNASSQSPGDSTHSTIKDTHHSFEESQEPLTVQVIYPKVAIIVLLFIFGVTRIGEHSLSMFALDGFLLNMPDRYDDYYFFFLGEFCGGVLGFFIAVIADSQTGRCAITEITFVAYFAFALICLILYYSIEKIDYLAITLTSTMINKVSQGVMGALMMEQIPLPEYNRFVDIHAVLFSFVNLLGKNIGLGTANSLPFLITNQLPVLVLISMISFIISFTLLMAVLKIIRKEPTAFVVGARVLHCVCYSIYKMLSRSRSQPKQDILNYARPKFNDSLINTTKDSLKIFVVMIPMVFHGVVIRLLDKMWLDQMKLSSPERTAYILNQSKIPMHVLMFILINFGLKPCIRRCKLICRDLNYLVSGYIVIGLALIYASVTQVPTEIRSQQLPSKGLGQVRFINALSSVTTVSSKWSQELILYPREFVTVLLISLEKTKTGNVEIINVESGIKEKKFITAIEDETVTYLISSHGLLKLKGIDAHVHGYINNEVICEVMSLVTAPEMYLELRDSLQNTLLIPIPFSLEVDTFLAKVGQYEIRIFNISANSSTLIKKANIKGGGVYAFLIRNIYSKSDVQMYTVVNPSHLPFYFLYPQILLSVTGISLIQPALFSFVYTHSSSEIRGTLFSLIYLAEGIGSCIFICFSQVEKKSMTFTNIWVSLYFALMLFFLFCIYRYKL